MLAWLFGRPSRRERVPHARPMASADLEWVDEPDFVCASCGRSDLPETGDWDPTICLDCDAAINFDAELELS